MPARRALLLLALLATTPAFAQAPQPAQTMPQTAAAPTSADQRLRRLYEAEWAWRRQQDGRVEGRGPGALADHWPRVDPATQRERLAYWENALRELNAIPVDQLSGEERINAAVFRTTLLEQIGDVRFRTYEAPFNSDSFFWTYLAPQSGFANAEEYRRFIGRLRDLPRYFGEHTANMRAGLARGFSVPRVTLNGRDATIVPFTADGEANPLYAPFRRMPSSIPAEEQTRLRADGMAALREAAIPAYRDLLRFFREDYMTRARTTIGASEMPDGARYYQEQIRRFSTTDLTARQIHDMGLAEVARIRAEMETTMRRANFTGSFAEFIHFLRTDPQFYAQTPEQLMGVASYVVARANGQLGETIGTLPRFRHGIVPVPDEIAPIYTGGRGGLENCMFNTYNLPARPLYNIPALALHECTPGHSFQAALALEGPNRPEFRQQTYFSGYGEGWGLYVEWLGTIMGIYRTPYEDFGRLTYEMWRATRLVIDTGLHAYGWSRERALAYLRDNTAMSELEIVNEIDRYISWPGQAVAYKLGQMTILRLRREAERRLGSRFDQRTFHDAILHLGSVPLNVLEEQMEAYIVRQEQAAQQPQTTARQP
ncbi:DUF885 domain-containing protein [Sphingosinicella sp.]|uniref:DUF885 domain-containing protein n=1 Tax=Sphingosinicella sp. TaxID=1917971 RepID=UPI004037FC0E